MGNFCSSKSTHSGGHTLVGPSGSGSNQTSYGTTGGRPPNSNPRSAALAAAENRRKAEQNRGTNAANPNHGRLAAKLQASKAGLSPEEAQPERLVWD